jgi:hypothetical protein
MPLLLPLTTAQRTVGSETTPVSDLAAGLLNNDAFNDMVVTTEGGSVLVYLNSGSGIPDTVFDGSTIKILAGQATTSARSPVVGGASLAFATVATSMAVARKCCLALQPLTADC